jgi:hypothetical protein
MVEHLAKVVAIHPSAARRTSIKMLPFGQIAHAIANVPPARKLNDRAVPFSHVARRYENPARALPRLKRAGLGNPPGECFLQIIFVMRAPLGKLVGAPDGSSPNKIPA